MQINTIMFSKWKLIFISAFSFIVFTLCIFAQTNNNAKRMEEIKMDDSKNIISDEKVRIEDARKRRGDHYANLLELFIDDCKTREKGGLVFVGDSITEGFPTSTAFRNQNVANRGIGGDKIEGVIERLDVSVSLLEPKKIYLMIGINDIESKPSPKIEYLKEKYTILIKGMKKAAPKAEINIQSILPLCSVHEIYNNTVIEFNKFLVSLAKDENVNYVDIYSDMIDKNGKLRESYTMDGIHLNLIGYVAWLNKILPQEDFFNAMLNVSGLWKERHSKKFKISKIDPVPEGQYPGNRGPDELIIYTPKYSKTSTGTNIWGCEVIVKDGIITGKNVGDSEIPKNGFVISGHGKASLWISSNTDINMPVEFSKDEVTLSDIPSVKLSNEQKFNRLRTKFMEFLNEKFDANSAGQSNTAKMILFKIQKIEKENSDYSDNLLNDLEENVNSLYKK